MHIPDNYLSPATCAALGAAMVPVWAVAVRKVKKEITKLKMPLLGIGSAFSFLIMMFNIPLPGGTTGHAVGAVLLAILVGPFSACISVSVALLIQALLFGDGGVLSFGANAFNMAFLMPFAGYFIYKFIKDRVSSTRGELVGMAVGAYVGINLAALMTAIEFGIQPLLFHNASGQALYCPYPLSVSVPAMMIPHLLIVGLIEAVFTVAVFGFIKRVSPGTIHEGAKQKTKAIYGLIFVLVCLTPVGLLATGTAWGEWDLGKSGGLNFKAILPDYALNGLPEVAGYILSAVAGVAILIIIFKILGKFKRE
ncbi:MAG: cobalt transporter CbiM [Bacillota bacterium]